MERRGLDPSRTFGPHHRGPIATAPYDSLIRVPTRVYLKHLHRFARSIDHEPSVSQIINRRWGPVQCYYAD